MISPLCTDDELVSASRYLQSPVARILAERLEVRARQMKQARAILTRSRNPSDPHDEHNIIQYTLHVLDN